MAAFGTLGGGAGRDVPGLTAVLDYRLTGTAAAFAAAASSLALRVRAEGDAGVLSYRIYLDPTEGQATGLADYRDSAAWVAHHACIAEWPELAVLRAVSRLTGVTFLGDVTPAMVDWMARALPDATLRHGAALVAGFARD